MFFSFSLQVSHLYKEGQIAGLLAESEHIAQRRKEAADMLKVDYKKYCIFLIFFGGTGYWYTLLMVSVSCAFRPFKKQVKL